MNIWTRSSPDPTELQIISNSVTCKKWESVCPKCCVSSLPRRICQDLVSGQRCEHNERVNISTRTMLDVMKRVAANSLRKCVDGPTSSCQHCPTHRDVHVCSTPTPGVFFMHGLFLAVSPPSYSSLSAFPYSKWHISQWTTQPNTPLSHILLLPPAHPFPCSTPLHRIAQCIPNKYFLEKLSEYEECLFGQTTVTLHDYHRGDSALQCRRKSGGRTE